MKVIARMLFDAPPNVNHESLFDDFESISQDIKVNRSENRSRSEGQSNRYNWMMGDYVGG